MLIIDTYNVLHVTGVLPPRLAGPEVDDLAGLIEGSRYADRRALLVCDGSGEGRTVFGCQVVYAGPGRDADTLIERLVSRWRHGRTLTVVSSDREVRRGAGKVGARVVGSGEFLRQLAEDAESGKGRRGGQAGKESGFGRDGKPIRLTGAEVGWWLQEFGFVSPFTPPPSPTPSTPPTFPTFPTSPPSPPSPPSPISSPASSTPPSQVTSVGDRVFLDEAESGSRSDGVRAARGGVVGGDSKIPSSKNTFGGDESRGVGKKGERGRVAGEALTDPVLAEAFRHWALGIDPSDLDMERWLLLFPPPKEAGDSEGRSDEGTAAKRVDQAVERGSGGTSRAVGKKKRRGGLG